MVDGSFAQRTEKSFRDSTRFNLVCHLRAKKHLFQTTTTPMPSPSTYAAREAASEPQLLPEDVHRGPLKGYWFILEGRMS